MPVNIHGKQYKTVAERINELKETEVKYSLVTEIISWEDNTIVMKATLKFDGQKFTGHAYEKENTTNINRTSALENCETSCIGRALASAGYGGEEFASADELVNALAQQQQPTIANQTADTKPKQNVAGAKFVMGEWSKESRKEPIPFGKYKKDGLSWGAVPIDYLKWVEEKSTMGDDAKNFAKLEREFRLKSSVPKKSKDKTLASFADDVVKRMEDGAEEEKPKSTKSDGSMTMEEIKKKFDEEDIDEELPF